MALGGGMFYSQTKILPGAYINFISVDTGNPYAAERGYVAMGLELDWGKEGEVFSISLNDAMKNAQEVFGYPYSHEKMKGVRDVFRNATVLYVYRLDRGGTKASNEIAEALYSGTRGNDLKISIQQNVDDDQSFDVLTLLGAEIVDRQTAKTYEELEENTYVAWKGTGALSVKAQTALSGGTNGTATGESHQAFLDAIESYSVNAIGAVTTDDDTKSLYCNFVTRMRDEVGRKLQVVVYNKAADYEGVVNVKNKTTDPDWNEASAVFWVAGAIAGAEAYESNTNKNYDGEFTIDTAYTQNELEDAILAGEFTFHDVDGETHVLVDINSLTTETADKGEIFKDNLTIRVIDDIAVYTASIFSQKYIGKIMNDRSGQVSLWSDIVAHMVELQDLHAIADFTDEDVQVESGEQRRSVVVNASVMVPGAMEKLYMTCVVG